MTDIRTDIANPARAETGAQGRSVPRIRYLNVIHMSDGVAAGQHVELEFRFEDTCRPLHMSDAAHPSALEWFVGVLDRAAAGVHKVSDRPLSIDLPAAALTDRDAPMAAEAAVGRAGLLPQEVRIDIEDATLSSLEDAGMDRLEAFRRRGFRVGLDARAGWRTPMGARSRQLIEAVRLRPAHFDQAAISTARIELCAADGMQLIAEGVRWREADELSMLGVGYAIAPRADA